MEVVVEGDDVELVRLGTEAILRQRRDELTNAAVGRIELVEHRLRADEPVSRDGALVLRLDRRRRPLLELARLELGDALLHPVRGVRAHVAIGPAGRRRAE